LNADYLILQHIVREALSKGEGVLFCTAPDDGSGVGFTIAGERPQEAGD
jgi:hypothetical protein